MAKSPLISIVVVNWNGLENTKECLTSLRKLKYPNYEIIIVDNGSEDGSKKYLSKIKDIVFVDLPKNTGFTGGHIEGYKVSRGDYLALLNNDLVVSPNWLDELMKVFREHKDAAAAGGKSFIWNDESKAYDDSNPFYSYQEVEPNQAETRTLMTGESLIPVDSISGAALIFDKSKLADVGYLDNDFFAYYEETDLIARLKRKGYNAYFQPTAQVWHKIAASSEGGDTGKFYLYQMHRNRYFFAYKNFDEPNLKRFLSIYGREVFNARLRKLMKRGDTLEAECRVQAYKDAKGSLPQLRLKRQEVLKLGESYNGVLGQHKPDDVTVVIPCYNYADYVDQAIDSALKQSHKPAKIIVINDGSTDDSWEKIKKHKNNPMVEVINKKNEGVIATKNLGINLSKTYWTLFLDADDILEEDALKAMLRSVEIEGRCDVIYSDMWIFGSISDYFRAKPFHPDSFLAQNYVNNSALINTTELKRGGGYKQAMKDGLEDWELYVTLFENGANFRYVPQPLVKYRQHHQHVISRNAAMQDVELGRRSYGMIRTLHPGLYRKYGKKRTFRRLVMAGYLLARHPGVIIVAFKSIPSAITQGLRHILHNMRLYLRDK